MAFQDHLSEGMALHHQRCTGQHLAENGSVLRGILPESTSDGASRKPPPTWLLRRQNHHFAAGDNNFLHLQTINSDSSNSNQWLFKQNDDVSTMNQEKKMNSESTENNGEESSGDWERTVKCKAEIVNHPLYDQLLSVHVQCLRIATPVDQLPMIDAQLAQSQHSVAKYSMLGGHGIQDIEHKDLDHFMSSVLIFSHAASVQLCKQWRISEK
ncbi:unnamed protein product, partial [Ilex paraguariensis]